MLNRDYVKRRLKAAGSVAFRSRLADWGFKGIASTNHVFKKTNIFFRLINLIKRSAYRPFGFLCSSFTLIFPKSGHALAGRILERALRRPFGANRYYFQLTIREYCSLQIDPNLITAKLNNVFLESKKYGVGKQNFISQGDWDVNSIELIQDRHVREIFDLIENNLVYEKTKSYADRMTDINSPNPPKRKGKLLNTKQRVEQYFLLYVNLIRSVHENGYMSRAQIRNSRAEIAGKFGELLHVRQDNDIGCAIGRHGELLLCRTGKHRLAAAIKLGVPSVPIRVQLVHPIWIDKCKDRFKCDALQALKMGLTELNEQYRLRNRDTVSSPASIGLLRPKSNAIGSAA